MAKKRKPKAQTEEKEGKKDGLEVEIVEISELTFDDENLNLGNGRGSGGD